MNDEKGRTQIFGWGTVEWLFEPGENLTGHASVALITLEVGKGQAIHTHAGFEEFLYILSGTGVQWISGVAKPVMPGLLIHNPPNVDHAFQNIGDTSLRLLSIYFPIQPLSIFDRIPLVDDEPDLKLGQEEPHFLQSLQSIQDQVAKAMGMAALTIDSLGNPLIQSSGRTEFCQLVRTCETGLARCTEYEQGVGIKASAQRKAFISQCYLGLTNVVVPIKGNKDSVWSVVCGEVLLDAPSAQDIENIRNAGIAIDQAESAFRCLPVVSKSRIYIAAELLSNISNHFVEMEQRIRSQNRLAQALRAKAEMSELLKRSELKALQAQINPHFLFNTLNTIANLAFLEGAPQTREMVYTLSELMRYALRAIDHQVTIQDEIDQVRNYFFIQSVRFPDRLEIFYEIQPEILDVQLPPLILQPFIENAIQHGLQGREKGKIWLRGWRDESRTHIEIQDNGIGITQEKVQELIDAVQNNRVNGDRESIGITNVCRRLQHTFEADFLFGIQSDLGQGTTICLTIPYARS